MTSAELAEFVSRSRKLFRGEMDEELFALAKARIAGLKFATCISALDDYALMHGGARARFIPAKFFEFYGRIDATVVEQKIKSKHLAEVIAGDERAQLDREAVDADWINRRRECESLLPSNRAEIVTYLRGLGWPMPPASIANWSRSWLLAVSDIGCERVCTVRMIDGAWIGKVSAREFYRDHAGIPSTIPYEATVSERSLQARPPAKPLGEPSGAVSVAPDANRTVFQDGEEIPF